MMIMTMLIFYWPQILGASIHASQTALRGPSHQHYFHHAGDFLRAMEVLQRNHVLLTDPTGKPVNPASEVSAAVDPLGLAQAMTTSPITRRPEDINQLLSTDHHHSNQQQQDNHHRRRTLIRRRGTDSDTKGIADPLKAQCTDPSRCQRTSSNPLNERGDTAAHPDGTGDEDSKQPTRSPGEAVILADKESAWFANDEDEMDALLTWFNWHDTDQDGQLDGNDLLQAFGEWDREDDRLRGHLSETRPAESEHQITQQLLVVMKQMVDHVLFEDDLDRDGLVSVSEFLRSQNY